MGMTWTAKLPDDVRERLWNCSTMKRDVPILVNAKWFYMKMHGMEEKGYTKEDALVQVLELLDGNGRFFDPTPEEWEEWKS